MGQGLGGVEAGELWLGCNVGKKNKIKTQRKKNSLTKKVCELPCLYQRSH